MRPITRIVSSANLNSRPSAPPFDARARIRPNEDVNPTATIARKMWRNFRARYTLTSFSKEYWRDVDDQAARKRRVPARSVARAGGRYDEVGGVECAREHIPPDHVREDGEPVAPLRARDPAREQLARRQSYPKRNGRPPERAVRAAVADHARA